MSARPMGREIARGAREKERAAEEEEEEASENVHRPAYIRSDSSRADTWSTRRATRAFSVNTSGQPAMITRPAQFFPAGGRDGF